MRPLSLLFLLLTGCDEVEEDLEGKLVRVEVKPQSTDCTPARFTGDAGIQFFGERADGGLVFTMGQHAQYGPTSDGGVLEGVQRQQVPSTGAASVGEGDGCVGSFSEWESTSDGLKLLQEWPGVDGCPSGPIWIPLKACTTTRTFSLTEVGTCQLKCVRISTSGEIDCAC